MIYGYIRTSTKDKQENSIALQSKRVMEAGATKLFKDKASGKSIEGRPALKELLGVLKEGDTIVCTKIDRLARNTKELLQTIEDIHEAGATLQVMNFGTIDNTPMGKMMITMLGAFAEFERSLIQERVIEGVERAKAEGKYKSNSRPRKNKADDPKLLHAFKLYDEHYTVKQIEEITGIKRNTFYRRLKEREILAEAKEAPTEAKEPLKEI